MNKSLFAATAVVALLSAVQAQAQTVNYAELEELFGEPVTTSATGKPQRQSEAPASMTIISGEQVRQSGVRSIPDILQNHAGIDVNRYSTTQRDVTIRGGNLPYNPRLLVLVNGRQVFLDHYGYTDWSLIGVEMEEIRQIEVVKGPNSALFGFNAVAGVVNIITIDPLNETRISGSVEGGTDDTVIGSLVGAFKLSDRVGVKLSGGYQQTEEWASVTTEVDDPEQYNFSGEVSSQLADNVRATASYTYSNSSASNQAYGYSPYNVDSELQGINGSVAADTRLGLIKGQVFYNMLDQDVLEIAPGFGIKNDILSAKLEDLFKVGTQHSFRLGAEYRRNEYELKNSDVGKTFYDVYAASAMWEWVPVTGLTLTTAGRVDQLEIGHGPINAAYFPNTQEDYDQSHTDFSYNAAISYQIDDLTRVRVGAARGIQAPSLNALGIYNPVETPPTLLVIAGNPNLEPGVTKAYEAAVDRSIPAIEGAFNLTVATTRVDGFLAASQNIAYTVDPDTGAFIITDMAAGDFNTYTVEATLDGKAMKLLSWELNYTWTDVNESLATADVETALTLNEGTPTHKVNLSLGYENQGWEAFLVGRYRSATTQRVPGIVGAMPAFIDLDDNVTLDARVGYRWNERVGLWAVAENLTGNDAAGLSAYDAESRFRIGLGYRY